MTKKITIAALRKFPTPVEERITATYDARLNPQDTILAKAEVQKLCEGAQGVICAPGDRMDAEMIAALPDSVEILSTFSVGYDHIDIAAAKARGLIVTHTPDVLTDATADIAMLCLLGAARRAKEGMALIQQDKWTGWTPTQLMGSHLGGKRLGILGMGRIGQAFATRAKAFGMEVHYYNRKKLSPDLEAGARYHDTPESLLGIADVLSLHFPSTPETQNFLNEERIALLPDGAIVVNTARGDVIDDDALIAALKSGKVKAAGLDVYKGEPNMHPTYRHLDTVFALPHLGSGTLETRTAMGFCCLDNMDAHFAGRLPPNYLTHPSDT